MYPEAHLSPSDPVQRAKMHCFIDAIGTAWQPFLAFCLGSTKDANDFLTPLEKIQSLLPEEGYAVGQFSIADAAIAPILLRIELCLEQEFPTMVVAEVRRALEALRSPGLARLRRYLDDLQARSSVEKTWHPVSHFVFAKLLAKPDQSAI